MRVFPVLFLAAVGFLPGLRGGDAESSHADAQRANPAPSQLPSSSIRFVTALAGAQDLRGKATQPGDPVRILKPFGVAVDEAGRIFVADPGQRAVLVYDSKQGTASRWSGNARVVLGGPVGVAFHPGGRLFVADGYRSHVVVFDNSGQAVASFGGDALKRPQAIAVDPRRDRVYVADTRLNQVLVFNAATYKLESTIGKPERPFFSSPSHLAVDSRGNLYVTDMWICRIQVFGPDGALLQRVTARCEGTPEYDRPRAIAIDRQDRVYVADPRNNSVQVFQPDGKPIEFVAGLRGRPGKSCVRTGMAIDRDDRIYVAEQMAGEGRVQVFVRSRGRR